MIDGICIATNKHLTEDESKRLYYLPGQKIPGYSGDLCARLKAGFLKLDIDDFDHKTGEIDDPVQDKPGSEAVKAWLDSKNIRYNLMITEHGKHFYFRVPANYPHDANKVNWFTALGIKVEVKLGGGTSKKHIPFKVGGVLRQWAVGSMENENIDDLPAELWPLQKPKNKPFDFSTLSDARNNGFSEYAFHLAWKGYTVEQIQSAIHGITDFVLDASLWCQETDTFLREETLDKLRNIINQKEEKNLAPVAVANELIDCYRLIYFNGSLYAYQGGVYKSFGKDRINAYISKHYPFAKIRFRQFNADYNPHATCPALDKMLNDAFGGSSEQIELFNPIMGYLLMNHVRYQKCFFWIGFPSSGKSTVSMMVRHFCGEENVSAIELEDLGKRFGLAGIVNKMLNIVPDIKKTKMFGSCLFKALGGGDAVRVEAKYREADLWHEPFPGFSADFEGIERRVVILKFERIYRKNDPDYNPNIDDDLATDEAMSALLNRAIIGYKSLIQNKGFIETRKSKQQLAKLARANNSLRRSCRRMIPWLRGWNVWMIFPSWSGSRSAVRTGFINRMKSTVTQLARRQRIRKTSPGRYAPAMDLKLPADGSTGSGFRCSSKNKVVPLSF